jgi:hypothetical protein
LTDQCESDILLDKSKYCTHLMNTDYATQKPNAALLFGLRFTMVVLVILIPFTGGYAVIAATIALGEGFSPVTLGFGILLLIGYYQFLRSLPIVFRMNPSGQRRLIGAAWLVSSSTTVLFALALFIPWEPAPWVDLMVIPLFLLALLTFRRLLAGPTRTPLRSTKEEHLP